MAGGGRKEVLCCYVLYVEVLISLTGNRTISLDEAKQYSLLDTQHQDNVNLNSRVDLHWARSEERYKL
jgi:hypothetical protein